MQRSCTQNKTSPNKGILLKGAPMPRLLNNPFDSCFLINFDFLLPHMVHFDNIITSCRKFWINTLSIFFFFFLHFQQ